jgi:predicted lipoprotein with Yx(FWY)xxD motif
LSAVGIAALTAGLVAGLTGVALATTYTVQMAKSSVSQGGGTPKIEKIAVSSTGHALYELTGDSKTHQECTKANHCFQFWPPATVKAGTHPTKGPGVPGTLSTWSRDGFSQLTLNGHPLYRYAADPTAHKATGQGVKAFGGTWHVITATKSSGGW